MNSRIKELYFDRLDSTQTWLREHWSEFPTEEWVSVRAGEQTGGRGQGSNTWESPKGNLYVTFSLAWPQGRNLSLLPLVVGHSLFRVVEGVIEGKQQTQIELKWKWVNDLYLNGGKVGGVLCESEIQGEDIRVFIGVGLNITSGVYASLGENLGLVGGEYLIEHIYSALRDQLYLDLNQSDEVKIMEVMSQNLYGRGARVRLTWPGGEVEGKLHGINTHGHLQLRLDSGLLGTYITGRLELV